MSRIFIFLGYNYSDIFQKLEEGKKWLDCAVNYQAHPTTLYCAFDFLSNICEDYFNEELLDKLTDHISLKKTKLIWETIARVVENHFSEISLEGIQTIITKVFIRLKNEIEML